MSETQHSEPCRKRVRAFIGGRAVLDTVRAKLVWEVPHYPQYWIPKSDVRMDLLTERVTAKMRDHGDFLRFIWDTMDAWFEEDEEVFVHPHDPNKRIDILASSRHVKVVHDGVILAETRRPTMLFETGAVVRTYIPKIDVRMDLLEATGHQTGCAYKGFPRYWRRAGTTPEVAWSYPTPLPETIKIAGLVAFYDERVEVIVDGVRTDNEG